MPRYRRTLMQPSRNELRLKNGGKIAISTICSLLSDMTTHGNRLAREIGCPYEEQGIPDEERSQ